MKTSAHADFARSLPSLVITALVSAGSVVALAVVHSLATSEVSQPPKKVANVAKFSPDVSRKSPVAALPKQDVRPRPETQQAAKTELVKLPVDKPEPVKPDIANTEPKKVEPAIPEPAQPPAAKTLQDLRADYERERKEFFAAIDAELSRLETAAKDAGDEELIKKATAAREAYAKGMIPKEAPGKELIELMFAREIFAKAMQSDLRSAREKGADAQVAALEKEFYAFMEQESADIGDVNWRFPECTFRLINVATGLALAAHDEGNGAAVIQTKENPADPLQHWFVRFPGQWYSRVRLRKTGRNLNVPASDRASGREIIMWHEEHQHNGYWELQYRGNYYHVRSLFSGKLLSVAGAEKTEGKQLIQWDHHDDPDDQKWKLIRVLPELDEKQE